MSTTTLLYLRPPSPEEQKREGKREGERVCVMMSAIRVAAHTTKLPLHMQAVQSPRYTLPPSCLCHSPAVMWCACVFHQHTDIKAALARLCVRDRVSS